MANYLARVELHGKKNGKEPGYSDYNTLHDAMETAGFLRTIVRHGVTYDLPHATYHAADKKWAIDKANEIIEAAAAVSWPDSRRCVVEVAAFAGFLSKS